MNATLRRMPPSTLRLRTNASGTPSWAASARSGSCDENEIEVPGRSRAISAAERAGSSIERTR